MANIIYTTPPTPTFNNVSAVTYTTDMDTDRYVIVIYIR